ncbi:MAG TPA: DNA repair protein RecO [Polyangiaceae bacterium]|nr:DNA repair protein RecO [Polyangiaceae bacterium]
MFARRTSSPARVAHALLLRRVEYGDSDLVVTLLTDTIGRVSALARGARRSVKRFGGVIEPMHTLRIAYDDRSGAELVVLREAKLARARPFLVTSLEGMQAAGRALNWVRKAAPPRTPEPEVWAAMEGLLDQLSDPEDLVSPQARLAATGLRLLSAFGWGIDFERCVSCGKAPAEGQAAAVDAARGGLVCRDCGGARRRLSGSERTLLQRAASGGGTLNDDCAGLTLELVEQALKTHGGIE